MSILAKKYKIFNKEHISFNRIDNVINNLHNYYNIIKQIIHQGGGQYNKKDDKYFAKYKKLIKSSERSIKYYKNFAQEQISKQMQLNQYYTNLVYMLNTQKEYLLNEYLKLGKNVKNNKEKISMLETMIDGIEKYMKTPVEFENVINKIVLKGGDMDFNVFESNITHELDDLESHMNDIKDDKKFVETKIVDLHKRMQKIVEEHENLFKIKTEIDWIVKELEFKEEVNIMEAQNFDELHSKLKTMIDKAKGGSSISSKLADYVHKLEEYATYLENFIKSNEKTINTIDSNKKPAIENHYNETEQEQDDLKTHQVLTGGNLFGGKLRDDYNKKLDGMLTNILDKFDTQYFTKIEVKDYLDKAEINKVLHFSNYEHDLEKSSFSQTKPSDLYRQIVTIIGQLAQLDNVVKDYDILYRLLENNEELLKYDESSENNIINTWNKIFEKKNTDFYNNQILKYKIFFYNPDIKTFEDALKNLKKNVPANKLTINIILNYIDTVSNEALITKIDETIVAMDHLVFFLLNFILGLLKLYKDTLPVAGAADYDEAIKNLEVYIPQKQKLLLRTGILTTHNIYSKLYDNSNTNLKGGKLPDNIEKIIPIININQVDKDILYSFISSSSANLLQSSVISKDDTVKKEEKTVLTKVNLEQMNKLSTLANMLDRLNDKINLKLGIALERKRTYVSDQEKLDRYRDLLTKIDDETAHLAPVIQVGGNIQPRLTPFEDKLKKCSKQLVPYIKNINKLKYLISDTRKKELDIDETKAILGIYTKLKKIVNTAINSYMTVIPMVFFTVEYPPKLYNSELCKYKFTYEQTTDLVKYEEKGTCIRGGIIVAPGEGEEKQDEGQIKNDEFHSHAAFLESNNQNGTKKIIDDPIIGLGKLLDSQDNKNDPINRVMNIMFALGASGTGKTSRYFGIPNAQNPDDRVGIVPYIIQRALLQNVDGVNNNDRIAISYFVCYGRYEETQQKINELLLFFNIDKIINEVAAAPVPDSDKYMAYMQKDTTGYTGTQKYTDFYTKLINKNFMKFNDFTNIEDFVTNGGEFLAVQSITESGSFRNVLKNPDIWFKIENNGDISENLKKYFDKLLNEQKKINTILPTQNNIESSRGHTCVLIRIKDNNGYKYFPLFDMAGTEDTVKISGFLNEKIQEKVTLIKKINEITQSNKITSGDNKAINSLTELFEEERVKEYLQNGGMNVTELIDEVAAKPLAEKWYAKAFINKIVNEGYYINHTIGTIIFAAMCVGESLKTTNDGTVDNFDDFGNNLFKDELPKYTCLIGSGDDCTRKPKLLLDDYSFDSILNSSCIWAQIIFSFLYWNAETQDSTSAWLNEAKKNKITESPYVYDMKKYNFVDNIPIKYAKTLSQVDPDFSSLKDNFVIINNFKELFQNSEFVVSVNKNNVSFTEFSDAYEITFEDKKVTININDFINHKDKFEMLFRDINSDIAVVGHKPDNEKHDEVKKLCTKYQSEDKNIFKHFVTKLIFKDNDRTQTIKKFFAVSICSNPTFFYFIHKLCIELNTKILEKITQINVEMEKIKQNIVSLAFKNFLNKGYSLKYDASGLYFYKNALKIDMDISDIIKKAKEIPILSVLQQQVLDLPIRNQMLRIKDARITATKMILMHLVTGQQFKHDMVIETINLTENLYNSTNIKFSKNEDDADEKAAVAVAVGGLPRIPQIRNLDAREHMISALPTLSVFRGGSSNQLYKEKYLKYREKYLKLKYNIN